MKKNNVRFSDDADEFDNKKRKTGMNRRSIELISGHKREIKNLKHAWLEHATDFENIEEFYQ